jgi:valyl-tRNA synthetase
MPFVTEELWQRIPVFEDEKKTRLPSICVAKYPSREVFNKFEDDNLEKEIAFMNHFIKVIRSTRSTYEIPNKIKTEGRLVLLFCRVECKGR